MKALKLIVLFILTIPFDLFAQITSKEDFYTIKQMDVENGSIENVMEFYPSVYAIKSISKDEFVQLVKSKNPTKTRGASGTSQEKSLLLQKYKRGKVGFELVREIEYTPNLIAGNYKPSIKIDEKSSTLNINSYFYSTVIDLESFMILRDFKIDDNFLYRRDPGNDWKLEYTITNENVLGNEILDASINEINLLEGTDNRGILHHLTIKNNKIKVNKKVTVDNLSYNELILFYKSDFSEIITGNRKAIFKYSQVNDQYSKQQVLELDLSNNPVDLELVYESQIISIADPSGVILNYNLKTGDLISRLEISKPIPFNITSISANGESLQYSISFPGRGNLAMLGVYDLRSNPLDITRGINKISKNEENELLPILMEGNYGLYEYIDSYTLTDDMVSSYAIDSSMNSIAEYLTISDHFILHWMGSASYNEEERKYELETIGRKLDSKSFNYYIENIEAFNKTLIIDAPNSKFLFDESLVELDISSTRGVRAVSNDKNSFIVARMGNDQTSSLTGLILNGIGGEANFGCPGDEYINSIELEGYLNYANNKISSVDYYINTSGTNTISFIRPNKFSNVDLFPPEITVVYPEVIDSLTSEKDIEFDIRVIDNEGVYSVSINGNEFDNIGSDRYKYNFPLKYGENNIEIIALDQYKNEQKLTYSINREEPEFSAQNTAIFFAINNYDDTENWSELNNPIKDAEAIAFELHQKFGFDTLIIRNPTREQIIKTLNAATRKSYTSTDQLFVFFAGHGYFDDELNQGYIVASNSVDFQDKVDYLPYSQLVNSLDKNSCEHLMVTLDVCYGGAFFQDIVFKKERSETRGASGEAVSDMVEYQNLIRERSEYRTRFAVSSGGLVKVYDGDEHSPFTNKMLQLFRNTEPGQVLRRGDIRNALEDRQEVIDKAPFIGDFGRSESGSDFFFIRQFNN